MVTRKIIYYDAYCKICFRFINMVKKLDNRNVFDYEPIQSLKSEGLLSSPDQMKSVLLLDNHIFYSKSDAVLRIARFLKTPVSWLYVFSMVPKFIRDKIYDFVANRRYIWFGKCESCV